MLDEAKNKKLSRKNVNEYFSEITMKQRKDLVATVKRIREMETTKSSHITN